MLSLVLSTCIDIAFLVHPLPLRRSLRQACIPDKQPTSSLSSVLFLLYLHFVAFECSHRIYFYRQHTFALIHQRTHRATSSLSRTIWLLSKNPQRWISFYHYHSHFCALFNPSWRNYYLTVRFTTLSICVFAFFYHYSSLVACNTSS